MAIGGRHPAHPRNPWEADALKDLWPLIPLVNGKPLFVRSEFDSKDKDGSGAGTGDKMHPLLVFMLVALRQLMGLRFDITSGYRTAKHNKAEKGAPQSAHLDGMAVDIRTTGWSKFDRLKFIKYARCLGFNGVGIASGFIHLDIKQRVASWVYLPSGMKSIPVGTEDQWV